MGRLVVGQRRDVEKDQGWKSDCACIDRIVLHNTAEGERAQPR